MKKIILFLLLSTPILCKSQNLPKDRFSKVNISKYERKNLHKEVKTLQQLIFNITASFQMFARDSTSNIIYKPIVIIDSKPYNDDNYPNIAFNDIKHFEIIKSYDGGYFINGKHANISIIIQTKD